MSSVADNYQQLLERIDKAARGAGRDPKSVEVMAVTKMKTPGQIEEAYRAGIRLFGENRVQEAVEKYTGFHEDAKLHIVGHLQSNKARQALEVACCVQSIDKLKTAKTLDTQCRELDKTVEVYLEYNTSGEDSKSGFTEKDNYYRVLEQILELPHLRVTGLMTIAPFTNDTKSIRNAFSFLAALFEETRRRYPDIPLAHLSMGMTGDFEIAVEEGATLVRIGTLLFGSR